MKPTIQTEISSPEPKENVPAQVQHQDLQHQQQEQPQEKQQEPQVKQKDLQHQQQEQPQEQQQVIQPQQQEQPQEQQRDLQHQQQGPHHLLQEPQVHLQKVQSSLKSHKSYKEALDTFKKSDEITFICAECSYPVKSEAELTNHVTRHDQLYCTKCNINFQTKLDLQFHINYENNCERQWNCKECAYQGNSQTLLKTHLNEKHVKPQEVSFPCTMCNEVFNTKWYFKNHTRDKHAEVKEICRYFQQARCKFSADDCWATHLQRSSKDKFECHSCKDIFNTKNLMMKHRKISHRTKQCNEFVKGTCKHGDELCWYMHTNPVFYKTDRTNTPPLPQNTSQ